MVGLLGRRAEALRRGGEPESQGGRRRQTDLSKIHLRNDVAEDVGSADLEEMGDLSSIDLGAMALHRAGLASMPDSTSPYGDSAIEEISIAQAERTDSDLGLHAHRSVASPTQTAMGLTSAAIEALRADDVTEALELAVKGLVAFEALPEHLQDRLVEGRMSTALGALCCAFFDHERALRFYQIAAAVLSPASERAEWTFAARHAADLALTLVRERSPVGVAQRDSLLELAERTGRRLKSSGEPELLVSVSGRRLIADVWCEQDRALDAWDLVEHIDVPEHDEMHENARRELAALRLTRGRCLALLGHTEPALTELDAALSAIEMGNDLVAHMEALRLRSRVREEAGDTAGALSDVRRLNDRVWVRHQRQIGGFMDQIWRRAGEESRRRDLEQREQLLIRTAEQDPLTGLANRRGVERFCASMPSPSSVCLVLIDLDHFKAVNDRYGHVVGDLVLRRVARVLVGSVRAVDRVARWGGEEFLIAVPTGSSELGADAADRVRSRVGVHNWSDLLGDDGNLTLSAGVATGGAHEMQTVLARADKALYQAKRDGRNRVVVG